MGGHPNGDMASRCTVESFPVYFALTKGVEAEFIAAGGSKYAAFVRRLETAFELTSSRVADTGGGATLSVLLRRSTDNRMVAAWAGDTSIARLARGPSGVIVEKQTEEHGIGPYLDRMVGRPTRGDPRVFRPDIEDWGVGLEGQWFVVMSDGVAGSLVTVPMRERYAKLGEARQHFLNERGRFEELFEQAVYAEGAASAHGAVDSVARGLCATAVAKGSSDNCTAIVAAFLSEKWSWQGEL
jgi:serine/threonine protein phosphatase PrpC